MLLKIGVHICFNLVIYSPNLCGKPLSILALRLSRNSDNAWSAQNSFCVTIQLIVNKLENVSWLGWQRNTKGKFGPRSANLSDTMDPVKYVFV